MKRAIVLVVLCFPVFATASESTKGAMCVRNICLKTELSEIENLPWEMPTRNRTMLAPSALFNGVGKNGERALEGIRTDDKATAMEIIGVANEYGRINPIALPLHGSTMDYIHKIRRTCNGGFLGGSIKDNDGSVIDVELSAIPGQQVSGRQMWRVTQITMFAPGIFTLEQRNQFAKDLAKKYDHHPTVQKSKLGELLAPYSYYSGRYGKDQYQVYSMDGMAREGIKFSVTWRLNSEMNLPGIMSNEMRIRSQCLSPTAPPKI